MFKVQKEQLVHLAPSAQENREDVLLLFHMYKELLRERSMVKITKNILMEMLTMEDYLAMVIMITVLIQEYSKEIWLTVQLLTGQAKELHLHNIL